MGVDFFRDIRLRIALISSFCWGILAHGMNLFNKYAYHDEAVWTVGFVDSETFGLGRWGLAVTGSLARLVFGSLHSSSPVFNGLITIFCLAIILYIVCYRLNIENKVLIVALSGTLVCFPAITGIFGFIYTAPYYYVGLMLAVAGAFIYYGKKNIYTFLVCVLLMTLSVSIYQANIPVQLMVLLLFMLDEVYGSDMKWCEYFKTAMENMLICICFMGLYFVFNFILLRIRGVVMSGYKGASSFGVTGPLEYVRRIIDAYKRFIKPADYINNQGVSANMFPWSLKYYHLLLIVLSLVLIVCFLRSLKNSRKAMQIGIMILLSPLFAYFIYFMVGEDEVHGLMTFGEAFMFFIPAYIMERSQASERYLKTLRCCCLVLMFVIGFVSARYANVCYLKADVMQTEAIGYYNRLISRIQGAEGYTVETPVLYVNERSKNDEGFSGNTLFDPIYLPPYHGNSIINDFSWEETMQLWCGFEPVKADGDSVSGSGKEEIQKMPSYPDDGSIKMIDGTLVVKFAD